MERGPRRHGPGAARPRARVATALAALLALALALVLVAVAGCGAPPGPDGGGAQASSRATVEVLDQQSRETEVTLLMVGDVLVHQGVWQSGEHPDGTRSYDHLFAQVAPDVEAADVAIVNQETVLGGTGMGLSGYPLFNGPQEIGDAEAAAGFDVVLHATNHALDKGQAGIDATLGFWRERHPEVSALGIRMAGEGPGDPCVVERDGVRVAVLDYTFSTNGLPLPEDNPDAVAMLSEDRIAADVARSRELGADFVVACPHWGEEYQTSPNETQRRWAQVFADNGVDVVIGTHPHVLQPVEEVAGADGGTTLVFWSLGNFVSTQATADTMVGGMAKVTLAKDEAGCEVRGWELVPVVTQRAQGTSLTTYPLPSYTEELAAANGIRGVDGSVDFSRAWVDGFCSEVLGPGFDPATGMLASGA